MLNLISNVLGIILIIIVSCGETDNKPGKVDEIETGIGKGKQGINEIFGNIRLNRQGAAGYKIRLYNLSENQVEDFTTDSHGFFSINLIELRSNGFSIESSDRFKIDNSYAFHILDTKMRRVGILDFSEQEGLQGAIKYNGGIGFNIGNLEIVSDRFSNVESYDFNVQLSGGFYVDENQDGELDEIGIPSYFEDFRFGRELVVGSPNELFNMFEMRIKNSTEYEVGLEKFGGIFLNAKINQGDLTSLRVETVGEWLNGSKARINCFDDPLDGLLWESLDYEFYRTDGLVQASIATNQRDLSGNEIRIGSNHEKYGYSEMIRFIGSEIKRPPLISRYNLGDLSDPVVMVDRDDKKLGLISIFDPSGFTNNIILEIIRPAILEDWNESNIISETAINEFTGIDISFEYYLGSTRIEVDDKVFGSQFQNDLGSFQLPRTAENYSWKVSERKLNRSKPVNNDSNECLNDIPLDCVDIVEIPRSLLLESINEVDRVKVNIRYSGSSMRSGSSYWFGS